MAPGRKLNAQFGAHNAAAAVSRITCDADLQSAPGCHENSNWQIAMGKTTATAKSFGRECTRTNANRQTDKRYLNIADFDFVWIHSHKFGFINSQMTATY
jgi:hypothetical protein